MDFSLDLVTWKLTAALILVPIVIIFLKSKKSRSVHVNLPPGPKKLPILGNIQLISLPLFRCFSDLSKVHGPLMHLKLGEVDAVVVSSPEMAKEILKDKDPIFTGRPEGQIIAMFSYNYLGPVFSPYGEYWKQIRKICVEELLSTKSVHASASVRRDEVSRLLESIRIAGAGGEPVNVTAMFNTLIINVLCRSAFGKVGEDHETLMTLVRMTSESAFMLADIFPSSRLANALAWVTKQRLKGRWREIDGILGKIIREHERNRKDGSSSGNGDSGEEDLVDVLLRVKATGGLQFPINDDNIKSIILDMFGGGTETAASTIDWTMAELVRNPRVMAKAQAEVREMMKEKGASSSLELEEKDIPKLKYLKLVIMETLRLHPQGAVIPRGSREASRVGGYDIPDKFQVLINAWAIHRDPKYWPNPEGYEPERFENQPAFDYTGNDFRYLPFGSGRRVCPGMGFGTAVVALALAHLLYSFDWKLPAGVVAQDMDMMESPAITASRKEILYLLATPYQSPLYSIPHHCTQLS